jgi:hypothetical protein
MFRVQHQPVETGQTQHLGADRVGQRAPAANLHLMSRQRGLKFVRENCVIHDFYLALIVAYFCNSFVISPARRESPIRLEKRDHKYYPQNKPANGCPFFSALESGKCKPIAN